MKYNWINLDNLPHRKDGKIDWKNCNHDLVEFYYRGNKDFLYIENRLNSRYLLVLFHDNYYEIGIQSLMKNSLGKLYNFAINNNYKYSQGDLIIDEKRNLQVLDMKRMFYSNGKSSKGYNIKCLVCNNEFDISEGNLIRGDGCNVCSNHKVKIGFNDLWTTRPDIAKMLKNKEDGFKYMKYSNVLAEFKCLKCGKEIGLSYINNVTRCGLSCPFCSSGISYPNRLMSNLLMSLNLHFETEVIFDWCKFVDFYNKDKISYGRYDFVLDNNKLIIEMDGGLGHGNNPPSFSKYTKEELIYRDNMKDILAENHGYEIIRIDCNYKSYNRLKYCSANILNGKLSNYFNLHNIDWNYLNEISL